jgi:TldD protein
MSIDEDVLRAALLSATEQGCEYAEVRWQSRSGTSAMMRNGEPEAPVMVTQRGVCVRVIKEGALGFAASSASDVKSLRRLAQVAVRNAEASFPMLKKRIKLAPVKAEVASYSVEQRIKVEDLGIEEMLRTLHELDSNLTSPSLDAKIVSRFLRFSAEVEDKAVITNEGAFVRSRTPRVSLMYVMVALEPGKGTAFRYGEVAGSGGVEVVVYDEVRRRVVEEAKAMGRLLREGRSTPRGKVDVVLGSEVSGIVSHESSGHPAEADRIMGREGAQAGESYLKPGSVGAVVGTENVTLVDDPTIPNSYGFHLYDEEGVKTRRRTLIKRGVINEFLHSRETAHELGVESNGAMRASAYDREPIVRMSNTFILPGDYSLEELLKEVRNGVYIKSFTEWNIDDRRFNQRYVGLEAYSVENGEIGNPVLNPVLEITTTGLFSRVAAVGNDLEFFPGNCGKGDPMQGVPVWMGGPSVLIEGVELS